MTKEKFFKSIKKRDGRVVSFDKNRITNAIFKAMSASKEGNKSNSLLVCDKVISELKKLRSYDEIPTIEEIQDIVETELILNDFPKTAKAYILYRREHEIKRLEREDILEGKTTNLPFTTNALKVVAKRYLARDKEGNIQENPEQMFNRVARSLANVEEKYNKNKQEIQGIYEDFLGAMISFKYLPGGRTLANAGAETAIIPNCIVLNIYDSMFSIFDTLKNAALLQQIGAGLGFPFHLIRPAGVRTVRSRGISSGPVSFLHVYNKAFSVIKQQNRHGANMAIMRVDHPDVLDFIYSKKTEGALKNFNISIGLTNDFMQSVVKNNKSPWMCEFNGVKMKPRIIERDRDDKIIEIREVNMSAREIMDEIVTHAWTNGEPGVVFIDTVNETNPLPGLGRIEASNPCGEQFLHGSDVCNLGSINLEKFVINGKIDFDELKRITRIAIRLQDNVVDLTNIPVESVDKMFKLNRRIGLGIMGFADMLYQLNIPYNSDEGRKIAKLVMGSIQKEARIMSQELAEEKGVFLNYEKSIYANSGIKMRNAALTTIAPTGTLSMVFDVSGGVEPYFALSYHYKGILDGKSNLNYFNKHLKKKLQELGLYTDRLVEQIEKEGSLQNIDGIPEYIKRVFVVSMDISAEDHIKMQAAFQENVDNSISKTCNFSSEATKEDVLKGYILAWKLKCKGCTVYRDKSREFQVLNLNNRKEEEKDNKEKIPVMSMPSITFMDKGICSDCKTKMIFKEGCYSCYNCGNGKCSI